MQAFKTLLQQETELGLCTMRVRHSIRTFPPYKRYTAGPFRHRCLPHLQRNRKLALPLTCLLQGGRRGQQSYTRKHTQPASSSLETSPEVFVLTLEVLGLFHLETLQRKGALKGDLSASQLGQALSLVFFSLCSCLHLQHSFHHHLFLNLLLKPTKKQLFIFSALCKNNLLKSGQTQTRCPSTCTPHLLHTYQQRPTSLLIAKLTSSDFSCFSEPQDPI